MSCGDLDALLEKYQADPEVAQGIGQLTRATSKRAASDLSVATLIACNKTMLEELQTVKAHVDGLSNRSQYDPKLVAVVAQAIVAAKVEEKHGVSSEAIEHGVIRHHAQLGEDKVFTDTNRKMQLTIQQLIGAV